jgi:hypothetical protein
MTDSEIAHRRQAGQHIARPLHKQPQDVVHSMMAVQAQDYSASLWAIGLRTRGTTEPSIEQALAARTIVRTWPMRGTLHCVAVSDVRWMLRYLTPRKVAGAASRFRQLRLDGAAFSRSRKILTKAMVGGRALARDSVYALLEKKGIVCSGQRGIHILWRLAQEELLCFGARDGKQPTFVLLDEWIPSTTVPTRDVALARMALRYFSGHGPATLRDFAWWSGLTINEARSSHDAIKSQLLSDTVHSHTYWFASDSPSVGRSTSRITLLPPFDEYLVGYTDRTAAIDKRYLKQMHPGGGILKPTVVLDGQVIGTWGRIFRKGELVVHVSPFTRFERSQRDALVEAAARYGSFRGLRVVLRMKK